MWVPVPQFAHMQNRFDNDTCLPPQGLGKFNFASECKLELGGFGLL